VLALWTEATIKMGEYRLRCKKCQRTRKNNINKHKCWREYQLCGACNMIEHPEEYPNNLKQGQYLAIVKKHPRQDNGRDEK
jgi:hypothetical protein